MRQHRDEEHGGLGAGQAHHEALEHDVGPPDGVGRCGWARPPVPDRLHAQAAEAERTDRLDEACGCSLLDDFTAAAPSPPPDRRAP